MFECASLAELRRAVSSYVAGFDPALVSLADATRVVDHASAIEKMAATLKGLAAARVADAGAWKAGGDRSAAHHLARTTGTSVGQAGDVLDTARRLGKLPATAAQARRGELSAQQASAIADAASADPSAESRLLEQAKRLSLGELTGECARTKAAADPDIEARRRRIHEERFLRTRTDAGGAWNLWVRNNPEVGAEIMAALAPIRDRLFRTARLEGRREALEAYAADALAELARASGAGAAANGAAANGEAAAGAHADTPGAGGEAPGAHREPNGAATNGSANGATDAASPPVPACNGVARRSAARAKVIVRVDLDALLRGYPIAGETAELVGYGPVAVSAIRDLLDSADPFLAAVVTRGVDVVGVAHLGRRPSAHQQTCLEWLYPTCAAEGCSAVAGLEVDHRLEWASTHLTVFDLLDRLCPHHHDLKTLEGWALVAGRGKRAFVAPDDPRHPGHAQPVPEPAATGPPGG